MSADMADHTLSCEPDGPEIHREAFRHFCGGCGQGGLIWTHDGKAWRFMEEYTRKLHLCPSVTCRACGRQQLYWNHEGQGTPWRLYEKDHTLHDCPQAPLDTHGRVHGQAGFLLGLTAKARHVVYAVPGTDDLFLPLDREKFQEILRHPQHGPKIAARLQYNDSRLEDGTLHLRSDPEAADSPRFLPPPATLGRRP